MSVGFGEPFEVLDFKRALEACEDVSDISYLISTLSDGVAEDMVMTDFYCALHKSDDLSYLKDTVITAMDMYLEENEWDGDPNYGGVDGKIADAHKRCGHQMPGAENMGKELG